MKIKQCIFIFTLLFSCFASKINAQADDSNSAIMVTGTSHDGMVKLRWIPSNESDLMEALDKGFEVIRYTYAINGVDVNLDSIGNSKTIKGSNLKPISKTEWTAMNTDAANAVGEVLYNNVLDYIPSSDETLADALSIEKAKDGKNFALLMLAEQDVDIAEGLGLYLEDDSVVLNHEYLYVVKVMNSDIESGTFKILHTQNGSSAVPTISSAIGSDRVVSISWDTEGLEEYTLYNIERSDDDINFQRVNQAPFMLMSTSEANSTVAHYTDSIPTNGVPYYYRIKGLSAFGYESQGSASIMVMGRPPRKDVQLGIDSFYFDDDNLVFDWSFPVELESEFIQFNMLTMARVGDVTQQLNSSPIAMSARSYEVSDPASSAYYILEGKDINDYTYRSRAFLAQTKDSIPPAMPTGLAGEIRRDGKVSLSWDENTEVDLDGYSILYSNEVDGEYIQLTSSLLLTPKYVGEIDPTVEAEVIYYRVKAADHRFNLSEASAPLMLKRPDITPPSRPLLAQVLPRQNQVRIGWRLSSSKDVVRYELQRKPQSSTNWETLLHFKKDGAPADLPMIPGENIASQFIDTDQLESKKYNYRLLAIDDDGNRSSSLIKTITPYDDGLKGKIELLSVSLVDYTSSTPSTWYSEYNTNGGNPAGNTVKPTINNDPEERIFVHWGYKTKSPSSIKEYKVYRKSIALAASTNSALEYTNKYTIIATISHDEATALGDEYKGGGLGWLDEFTLKHPKFQNTYVYKVIAWHKDGGFSMLSNEKSIVY